jgi:hypothetical protein
MLLGTELDVKSKRNLSESLVPMSMLIMQHLLKKGEVMVNLTYESGKSLKTPQTEVRLVTKQERLLEAVSLKSKES